MPERFVAGISGHSARVGAAQDLAALDIDLAAITQAGGWKSTRMPLQYSEKINSARSGMARVAKKSDYLMRGAGGSCCARRNGKSSKIGGKELILVQDNEMPSERDSPAIGYEYQGGNSKWSLGLGRIGYQVYWQSLKCRS
jgi:hypothetical protein